MRTFFLAVKSGFVNCFNFTGRATRAEYWYFTLFYYILWGLIWGIDYYLDHSILTRTLMNVLYGKFSHLTFTENFLKVLLVGLWQIAYYALAFRRLHDINKTAWWLILSIPIDLALVFATEYIEHLEQSTVGMIICAACLVKSIFFLAWFCIESTPGENKYGPPSTALERK